MKITQNPIIHFLDGRPPSSFYNVVGALIEHCFEESAPLRLGTSTKILFWAKFSKPKPTTSLLEIFQRINVNILFGTTFVS